MQKLIDLLDEYFLRELSKHSSNPKAFEAAADKFEQAHGVECPIDYDAFRKRKERKRHKKAR